MSKIIITKENVEEVIAKQIDKIASVEENQAITTWRESSSENEIYYQHLIQVNNWYTSIQAHEIDIDSAWKNVSLKALKKETVQKKDRKVRWSYIAYAASILILAAAAWHLLSSKNKTTTNQKIIKYIASNEVTNFKLNDGSKVQLSPNSALSMRKNEERSFSFSGQAKFEVIHDNTQPFIVHMDEVKIKDLGTVFKIDAQPSNDTVFVKVTEGIVQFYTESDKGIIVEHGEEGMYIRSKKRFYKRSIDISHPFLSIVFSNATLGEVVDHLAYSFRKDISLENEKLRDCNISVDFTKAPFSIVKEIIEETLGVTIVDRENTLVIDGSSCK